jgi:hypothetical protein
MIMNMRKMVAGWSDDKINAILKRYGAVERKMGLYMLSTAEREEYRAAWNEFMRRLKSHDTGN